MRRISVPTWWAETAVAGAPSALVVEDEAIIALDIEARLVASGYAYVESAASLAEASAAADRRPFDIGILDFSLPDGNTIELARSLIASGTSVIFTTAFSAEDFPEDLRDLPRLEKPFEPASLSSLLERVQSNS
jgi:DNA-binding response OmpR family regulator